MTVQRRLRNLFHRVLRPLMAAYLGKTRISRYRGHRVVVPSGVFHPGLFVSTRTLLRHLETLPIAGLRVLEIGSGSGLIAIRCAARGALVTATDINPIAVEATRQNAAENRVPVRVVESDLFEALEGEQFDCILVIPPFYAGTPKSDEERAWFAGPDLQYFERFFAAIGNHLKPRARVLMVLGDTAPIRRIMSIASASQWLSVEVAHRTVLGERTSVFSFTRAPVG